MKVASGESESVSDCHITINYDGLSGGFRYELGTLSAGEGRMVPLNEFLMGASGSTRRGPP